MADVTHWGTAEDAKSRTGVTPSEDTLTQASAIIETVTGAIFAFHAPLLNKADRYWIDAATGYEAVWMADHPDLYTRMDASSFGQDGENVTPKADGLVLSPLARRCLKRLSWRGTRSLLPQPLRNATVDGVYPILQPGTGVRDYEGERWQSEA